LGIGRNLGLTMSQEKYSGLSIRKLSVPEEDLSDAFEDFQAFEQFMEDFPSSNDIEEFIDDEVRFLLEESGR